MAFVVGEKTWITVILNDLPWKRTEIILSFLRLHASTAFQTLVEYEGYSILNSYLQMHKTVPHEETCLSPVELVTNTLGIHVGEKTLFIEISSK